MRGVIVGDALGPRAQPLPATEASLPPSCGLRGNAKEWLWLGVTGRALRNTETWASFPDILTSAGVGLGHGVKASPGDPNTNAEKLLSSKL